MSGAVAFQLVGDQPPGRASLPLQQLAEESFGGFPITARLDEDIEHITILIYRAPEVLAFALYLYENLVQVPRVTETTLSTLQSPSVFRPELDTPKSDRFIGNGDELQSVAGRLVRDGETQLKQSPENPERFMTALIILYK